MLPRLSPELDCEHKSFPRRLGAAHSLARARLRDGEGRPCLEPICELLILPRYGEEFGLYRRDRLNLGHAAQFVGFTAVVLFAARRAEIVTPFPDHACVPGGGVKQDCAVGRGQSIAVRQ